MKKLFFIFLLLDATSTYAVDRHVVVMGNCLKMVTPDRGSVEFYAESLNNDSDKALKDATKTFENARDQVKKLNLKNLELSTLENSVQPENTWENNKTVFKGYRARIGLRVYTSDLGRLSEVTSKVSKSGIKNIGGLQTDISPAKLKEEQESCLAIAIENAKSKAEKMAKAASAKIGKVISIEEGGSEGAPPPRPMYAKGAMRTEADIATIDTKDETISTNVRVSFELN
ncbi:MAG: SIMPL domain-containing protein [Bdellovibrionota bacterium]